MNLPVTVGMQEDPVGRRITASIGPPDDMMVVPARQSGDLLMANGAETLLLCPQGQQLLSTFEGVCHLHAYAFLAGHFPLRVVGVRRPCDLHMPLDRHVPCTTARAFVQLPSVAHACPHAGPLASVPCAKVFRRQSTDRISSDVSVSPRTIGP